VLTVEHVSERRRGRAEPENAAPRPVIRRGSAPTWSRTARARCGARHHRVERPTERGIVQAVCGARYLLRGGSSLTASPPASRSATSTTARPTASSSASSTTASTWTTASAAARSRWCRASIRGPRSWLRSRSSRACCRATSRRPAAPGGPASGSPDRRTTDSDVAADSCSTSTNAVLEKTVHGRPAHVLCLYDEARFPADLHRANAADPRVRGRCTIALRRRPAEDHRHRATGRAARGRDRPEQQPGAAPAARHAARPGAAVPLGVRGDHRRPRVAALRRRGRGGEPRARRRGVPEHAPPRAGPDAGCGGRGAGPAMWSGGWSRTPRTRSWPKTSPTRSPATGSSRTPSTSTEVA
jgi:hypothetical protein